jgi:Fuc2NAc and GlcNAc transferase
VSPETGGLLIAVAAAAALLTGLVRRIALRRGALDVPNARSSHVRPTPRGGGIAIVAISLAAMSVLAALDRLETHLYWALTGGGMAVAVVGHLDDRGHIGIIGRFAVHIAAAIWATAWLSGLPELQWGGQVFQLGHLGSLLAVVGIVWALNLFNFMDGIDGIAASEAIFIAGGGALLASLAGLGTTIPASGAIIAAASLGFLVWNWPPARIFMGDVGSGFLGFVLAVMALAAIHERASMLPAWLILGGAFFVDATVTVVRRLARGERVYEAHRSHAYQWLARRWNSHERVSVLYAMVNLLWLAPWAWIALRFPAYSGWCVLGAWGLLVPAALASGAGRSEAAGAKSS